MRKATNIWNAKWHACDKPTRECNVCNKIMHFLASTVIRTQTMKLKTDRDMWCSRSWKWSVRHADTDDNNPQTTLHCILCIHITQHAILFFSLTHSISCLGRRIYSFFFPPSNSFLTAQSFQRSTETYLFIYSRIKSVHETSFIPSSIRDRVVS